MMDGGKCKNKNVNKAMVRKQNKAREQNSKAVAKRQRQVKRKM